MNEFQAINDVIDTSIRNSSYISVLISSGVFIIYTLINKLVDLFKNKDKNKPLIEMATAIKDVSVNVVMLNNVLNKLFRDDEKREISRTKSVITLVFTTFKSNIVHKCIDIIVHNHIDENKDYVVEIINKLVSTEYYKIYSALSAYEINDCPVSSKLKTEWIKEVIDDIISIIYSNQDSATRIVQLNNKLLINVNEYSTFVTNKIFN